jgi:uncharacterized membrane protein
VLEGAVIAPVDRFARLELALGRLLGAGVAASAALLAAGLLLEVPSVSRPLAQTLLRAGLFVLIATPIARVLASCATYLRHRDWLFAAAAIGVLGVLLLGVGLALRRLP